MLGSEEYSSCGTDLQAREGLDARVQCVCHRWQQPNKTLCRNSFHLGNPRGLGCGCENVGLSIEPFTPIPVVRSGAPLSTHPQNHVQFRLVMIMSTMSRTMTTVSSPSLSPAPPSFPPHHSHLHHRHHHHRHGHHHQHHQRRNSAGTIVLPNVALLVMHLCGHLSVMSIAMNTCHLRLRLTSPPSSRAAGSVLCCFMSPLCPS
jgi:hypothetical protein